MSKILESIREDLSALAAAGLDIDPDEVFRAVDRERQSGELAEKLRQTNQYLTELDENGNVKWIKTK